jgi:predicted metalloprotease with PDZ domain
MLDLSQKFGKNKAFNDDQLFDEITKMTFPEIGEFFKRYVKGNEKLPLQETFSDVGISYQEEEKYEDYTLGIGNENIGVTQIDGKPKLQISSTKTLNAMGQKLGFQEGDVLIKINGQSIPDLGPEFGPFIQAQIAGLEEAKTLSYTVLRKDATGENKEVELSAPVTKVELSRRHMLGLNSEATPQQVALRDSWLKKP